jgi:hypothetical protein
MPKLLMDAQQPKQTLQLEQKVLIAHVKLHALSAKKLQLQELHSYP